MVKAVRKGFKGMQGLWFFMRGDGFTSSMVQYIIARLGATIREMQMGEEEKLSKEQRLEKAEAMRKAIVNLVHHYCNNHGACGSCKGTTGNKAGVLNGALTAKVTPGAKGKKFKVLVDRVEGEGKRLEDIFGEYLEAIFPIKMCQQLLHKGFTSTTVESLWSMMYVVS